MVDFPPTEATPTVGRLSSVNEAPITEQRKRCNTKRKERCKTEQTKRCNTTAAEIVFLGAALSRTIGKVQRCGDDLRHVFAHRHRLTFRRQHASFTNGQHFPKSEPVSPLPQPLGNCCSYNDK
jgi:hypothetical protein